LAKIEMKYGSSSSSSLSKSLTIEIKPTIGDMLLAPQRLISVMDFDTGLRRMQGFSRIESHFALVHPNSTLPDVSQYLSERILSRAALIAVTNVDDGSVRNPLRFTGRLPSSLDPVYVLVSWNTTGTTTHTSSTAGTSTNIASATDSITKANGTIIAGCDHALVTNAMVQLLKRAIVE
jgi:hypothetical protein